MSKRDNLFDSYNALSQVSIGLDDFFDGLFHTEQVPDWTKSYFPDTGGFPPYDYFKDEEGNYVLRLAVPGFSREDLHVKTYKNVLFVEGVAEKEDSRNVSPGQDAMESSLRKQSFHSKIGYKSFKKKFSVAPYAEITNASLENGILEIYIKVNRPEDNAETVEISINGDNKDIDYDDPNVPKAGQFEFEKHQNSGF